MKVKTDSGPLTINKKSGYGKYVTACLKMDIWTGILTLQCRWEIVRKLRREYPSLSWSDAVKLSEYLKNI